MNALQKSSQDRYETDIIRLHLSVRWNTILSPFEQRKFLSLLPDEGYTVDSTVTQSPPFGSYPEASGPLARKGTVSLVMNTEKPAMGLDGTAGSSLVEELDIIEKVLKIGLNFDSPKHAAFYEVLSHALVWTEQDALAILKKSGNVEGIGSRFSEKTGLDRAVNAALRLIPINAEMHSDNWWDVHIEPSFRSPHQCYRVSIVYRHPDRTKVTDVTGRIEEMLKSSVELVEDVDE